MADNPLSFIFNGSDPNINAELRRRIALSMLSQKKSYPKTFGEGLSAIGDAIGDRAVLSRLAEQEKTALASGNARADELLGTTPPGGTAGTGTNTAGEAAPPPARTAYAPAAGAAAEPQPPAEPAAPNALAQLPTATETVPEDMKTTPTAAQPASTLFNAKPMLSTSIQTPPAGGFTPRDQIARTLAAQQRPPAGPGVSDGGYNLLDAQAGMKRIGTARGQAAAERAYPDNPDMQAYASQLAAGEQTKPGDTSSTGARGLFQFVPGTAKQYGLTNPDDDMASADALKALTADNAATFTAKTGRPPTMADLALMHQQGGATGANMVTGAGNASPRNLSLNNVPPSASPEAAAAKIKGYYGMPERPVDARQAVTEALMPKPPVMAFDGQPGNAAATPPLPLQQPPQQQIRPAPPAQPPIAQAPPPPGARGLPPPGYISPTPPEIRPPTPMPMSEQETRLRDAVLRDPNNEQLARRLAPAIQTLEANRTAENQRRIEQYKIDLQGRNTMLSKIEDQKAKAYQEALNAQKTAQEIRKGDLPEAIDVEGRVMRDPVTGRLTRPQIEGEDQNAMPNVKLTEDQRKTLTFHGWASLADKLLQDNKNANLLAHGASQEALGKVPIFGNQLQQDEYRRVKNAANNFVLAFMRSTSGAAYGPKEAEDHARAMLPKQGDDARTLADKAEQRKNFVDTLYGGLGPGRQVADFLAKQRKSDGPAANSAAIDGKQKAIDDEMKGITPKAFGEIKTNKKTGATRMWNGSHWVEM